MGTKWNPIKTERKVVEIDEKLFERRLDELAELFYDAFCELHKNRSVEPKLKSSCAEQELEKVG
ncbi:MAG: hypothetical protein ACLGG0_05640 [Bacteriovoracia bacterium]|nr:hypothetical protein [Bacteriovoracaceae bacterium]